MIRPINNIQVMKKKCLTKMIKWKSMKILRKKTFKSNKKDKIHIKKISLETKIHVNNRTISKFNLKTIKLKLNKL